MLRSDITIVIARMFSFRREGGKEGGGNILFTFTMTIPLGVIGDDTSGNVFSFFFFFSIS